jgi:hypothetical protein
MIMSLIPIRMFERRIIVVIPDFKTVQGGELRPPPSEADRSINADTLVEKNMGRARGLGRRRGDCTLVAPDLRPGEPTTFNVQRL